MAYTQTFTITAIDVTALTPSDLREEAEAWDESVPKRLSKNGIDSNAPSAYRITIYDDQGQTRQHEYDMRIATFDSRCGGCGGDISQGAKYGYDAIAMQICEGCIQVFEEEDGVQALFFPTIGRLGIASGADATWADVETIESGIEMWLHDPDEWAARN